MDDDDDGNPYASPSLIEEPEEPVSLAVARRLRWVLLVLVVWRGFLTAHLAMVLLVADYTPIGWTLLMARIPYLFGSYWVFAILLPMSVAHRLYRVLGYDKTCSGFVIAAWVGSVGAFAWTGIILCSIFMGFSYRSSPWEGWVFFFAFIDFCVGITGLYGLFDVSKDTIKRTTKSA